jgi:hypothetical protein
MPSGWRERARGNARKWRCVQVLGDQIQRTGGGREGWMRTRSLARCTRSKRARRKDGKARWRLVAMSSGEPRTTSSLEPHGSGEALMARQVGMRSCGAKAAVRHDELRGGTHGKLPLSVRRSKQEQCDTGSTRNAGLTASLARSRRHVRMQSNRLRANRLRARDAGAKEGLAREQMDPGGSRRSWSSEPIRLHRLVPGVHDVQQPLPSLIAQPTAITASHHGDYPFDHLPPTATMLGRLLRHPRNLVVVVLILSSPILFTAGIHFRLFFSITKVCPDLLNLLNTGDSFAAISSLSSYYQFSRPGT